MTTRQTNLSEIEYLLLDGLSRCDAPVAIQDLVEIAIPRGHAVVSEEKITDVLCALVTAGCIERQKDTEGCIPRWSLTTRGQARWAAETARGIFNEPLANVENCKCSTAAICDATEPVEDDDEPAVALLCVDEAELDGWWEALDVETKADAFAQYALDHARRNSHVFIEPEHAHVPVLGTVGESAAEWNAKAEKAAAR